LIQPWLILQKEERLVSRGKFCILWLRDKRYLANTRRSKIRGLVKRSPQNVQAALHSDQRDRQTEIAREDSTVTVGVGEFPADARGFGSGV